MKRRQPCSLWIDDSGVVFLEFLIAFVPLWTFFLCSIQVAFAAHADLVVKHAADSAARSAAVVLPDDPSEYGGEPQRSVDRNRASIYELGAALGRIGAALSRGSDTRRITAALSDRMLLNLGRSRLNTIRLAAHIPAMPLAPFNVGYDSRPSVAKAVVSEPKLLRAFYYQPFALAVTFPGVETDLATGAEITVRVTYAYQCVIPLARRLLCRAFRDLDFQEDLAEAFFPFAQRIVGGRFRVIRRETTVMLHDAPYEYRPQGLEAS